MGQFKRKRPTVVSVAGESEGAIYLLILGCDTSTDYAVFYVGDETGGLAASIVFKHQRDLSQLFYESLDGVLAKAGRTFGDINVLAVGVGPGSFTGVRVAVTTMKTLAQASKKLLVATGTLQAYAEAAGQGAPCLAILPSRRGEVYCQSFDGADDLASPQVIPYDRLFETLERSGAELLLCGQTGTLPPEFTRFRQILQNEPPSVALMELAGASVARGDYDSFLTLAPVYAAPPAISIHKGR
jgi:tRNA threonylcarbamoyladenosine biosynthesis protein TsaB